METLYPTRPLRVSRASFRRMQQTDHQKTITDAVFEVCGSFPEVEHKRSHGMTDFRVRGKPFATYALNHHGDGRTALWLRMPKATSPRFDSGDADCFFVPPYVGTRGWIGIHLDKSLSWSRIAALVSDAYRHVAPASLAKTAPRAPEIAPPTVGVPDEEFDPLSAPHRQRTVNELRSFCMSLPEVNEWRQFGRPAFRAGKKTFALAGFVRGRGMEIEVWVGHDLQVMLTEDPKFEIPKYTGHNGWIMVDVENEIDWPHLKTLIVHSYKHFALKRMLRSLQESSVADEYD